jgi:hypothetical protein
MLKTESYAGFELSTYSKVYQRYVNSVLDVDYPLERNF